MDYQAVISLLKQHEGFKSKPYRCTAGKLTIGFGTNLEDRGITEAEAEILLKNDLEVIEGVLNNNLSFFKDLSYNRRSALINMAYNLGMTGFFKFEKTIAFLEKGDFESAANEMLNSRWANQVGKRAKDLATMIKIG